jgi:two-component system, LytTR family, response regulator
MKQKNLPKENCNVKLCVKSNNSIYYIDFQYIIRLTSDNNYTKIFYQKSIDTIISIVCSKNLGHYENTLDQSKFIRVHNRHIVNAAFIYMFDKADNKLELTTGELIEVSVRKKQEVLNKLNYNEPFSPD